MSISRRLRARFKCRTAAVWLGLLGATLAGCTRTPPKAAADTDEPAGSRIAGPELVVPAGPVAHPRPATAPALRLGVPTPAPAPHEKAFAYDGTAIGTLVWANGGRVPATGVELSRALDALGDFAHIPVYFSSVALNSGLSHPRLVITQRHLPDMPADRPDLGGRLFLAVNTADGPGDTPRIASIEFISWNSRRARFDFGVIEGIGGTPELKVFDGARCFSCHKNRGPIFGSDPWSNTEHNHVLRGAAVARLTSRTTRLMALAGPLGTNPVPDHDPLVLHFPSAEAVDAGVRFGADLLSDRAVARALCRTPPGREALVQLFATLVRPGPLVPTVAFKTRPIDGPDWRKFAYDSWVIRQAAAPSRLRDIDPEGLMGPEARGHGWGGIPVELVLRYDDRRAVGNHNLPSTRVPSNPRAFERRPTRYVEQATEVANPGLVARVIGLTDSDRKFLADTLTTAAATANPRIIWSVTPDELAARVFRGASFTDVVSGGELPDRDDFKGRFVAGLATVLREAGYDEEYRVDRTQYASGPRRQGSVSMVEEVERVPTTACLGCHDIRTPGKATAFNPIPPLAFDPFDKVAREAWVKAADRASRETVLSRILKRMVTAKDMPPVDATEHELFRVKDPASFDAAAAFLVAELNKAKRR